MGAQANTLHSTDLLGLMVLCGGLGVYRYGDMKRNKKESKNPAFDSIVNPSSDDTDECEAKYKKKLQTKFKLEEI